LTLLKEFVIALLIWVRPEKRLKHGYEVSSENLQLEVTHSYMIHVISLTCFCWIIVNNIFNIMLRIASKDISLLQLFLAHLRKAQGELLWSLTIRRLSVRPFTFTIQIFSETACLISTKLCQKYQYAVGTNDYKK
jgi:hypothetical protein